MVQELAVKFEEWSIPQNWYILFPDTKSQADALKQILQSTQHM